MYGENERRAPLVFILTCVPLSRPDAAGLLRSIARNITLSLLNMPQFSNSRPTPNCSATHPLTNNARMPPYCGKESLPPNLAPSLPAWLTALIRTGHLLYHCALFATERKHLSTALRKLENQPVTAQAVFYHRCFPSQFKKVTQALLRFLKATSLS